MYFHKIKALIITFFFNILYDIYTNEIISK